MPMNRADRDFQGVLGAGVSFVAAVVVVGVLTYLGVQDNAVIVVTVMLLPLLVYGIVSGRLKELRGPWGWAAIFSSTVEERITRRQILPIEPIVVEKPFKRPDKGPLRRQPTVLQIKVDKNNLALPICAYLMYLASRLASQAVRYVIFVDTFGEFLAMIPVASFSKDAKLITKDGECTADHLIEWVAFMDKDDTVKGIKGFVGSHDAAAFSWSRRKCLETMEEKHIEALPVVEDGKIEGIAERAQLVTSLIVEVAAKLEK